MYTAQQITAALRRFLDWSSDGELRAGAAQLLEDGEIELAAIVGGEFVWKLSRPTRAMDAAAAAEAE